MINMFYNAYLHPNASLSYKKKEKYLVNGLMLMIPNERRKAYNFFKAALQLCEDVKTGRMKSSTISSSRLREDATT